MRPSSKLSFLIYAVLIQMGCLNADVVAQESATQQQVSPASDLSVGLTNSKPDSEPFVDLMDGRYMVPYTAMIPGTEVEFTMIPHPSMDLGGPQNLAARAPGRQRSGALTALRGPREPHRGMLS